MADAPDFAAALGRLTSGLYIVTTGSGAAATGFLASWVQQAGFEPPAVTVAVQKERTVQEVIRSSGHFCVHVLGPNSMQFMKHFGKGFAPGEDAFAGLETTAGHGGVPVLAGAHATLQCELLGESAWSDHVIFCGAVRAGGCPDIDETPVAHVRKNGLSY